MKNTKEQWEKGIKQRTIQRNEKRKEIERKHRRISISVAIFCGALIMIALIIGILDLGRATLEAQVILTPDGYRYPPTAIPEYTAPQNLTALWVDLGSEIKTDGYNHLTLWINLDINSSNNARVKVLAKTVNGGTNEFVFPIKTIGANDVKLEAEYFEFNIDADQLMIIGFDLNNTVPWIQVLVQVGTVGGTAGQIDGAWYSMGK